MLLISPAGLVCSERQGRFMRYSLAPGVLVPENENGETDHINLGCCRLELPKKDD